MKLSDHELRFALALYPFSVIVAKYSVLPHLGVDPLVILTAFALWIAYENYFAIRQGVSLISLVSVNAIGTATALALWYGNKYAICVTLALLVTEGVILNVLGLKKTT